MLACMFFGMNSYLRHSKTLLLKAFKRTHILLLFLLISVKRNITLIALQTFISHIQPHIHTHIHPATSQIPTKIY